MCYGVSAQIPKVYVVAPPVGVNVTVCCPEQEMVLLEMELAASVGVAFTVSVIFKSELAGLIQPLAFAPIMV